jgi:WD40 repeat protein
MAALTPIPTRGGPHPRASLLLRLDTPEQLGCVQLHPQGALLLAGAENGDVLLFATSSGGLVQVCWERRGMVVRSVRPPAKALWPATAAGAYSHLPPPARYLACLSACLQRLVEPSKSTSPVTCVAWAELDGMERVIAGHKSGNVRVWDVERAAGGWVVGRWLRPFRGGKQGPPPLPHPGAAAAPSPFLRDWC